MKIDAIGKTPVALIRQHFARGEEREIVRASERRAATTTRPPVPRGMYEKCKLSFFTVIDKCIKGHKIPREFVLVQSRPQVHVGLQVE